MGTAHTALTPLSPFSDNLHAGPVRSVEAGMPLEMPCSSFLSSDPVFHWKLFCMTLSYPARTR